MNNEDLAQLIQTDLERVETLLQSELDHGKTVIDQITSHLARAGGKRMRPALTCLVAQLGQPGQKANDEVIKAAVAVELTHLATLYHDDVMDGAPRRRGVDAAQLQWSNSLAILAGDIVFARASRLVAALGPAAVAAHSDTFERLCLGQMHETLGPQATEAENEDPVDFYLQVLADKTGSLVATAAGYGALLTNCPPEITSAVKDFGLKIGVAFQLADDVLDLKASPEQSGKTPGTDLREGVKTMPVLLLERHAGIKPKLGDAEVSDEEWERSIHLACACEGIDDGAGLVGSAVYSPNELSEHQLLDLLASDLSSDEALAAVVARLRAHPVLEETAAMARQWVQQAISALGPVPDGPVKQALIDFACAQVDRLN